MVFQNRIRKLRLEHDMSQEDLAQVLDVTRQSISKYENGTSEPSYDKLALLVHHFNVTYDDLLADDTTTTVSEDKPVEEESKEVTKESKEVKEPTEPVIEVISVLNPEEDELFKDFVVVEKPAYRDLEHRPIAVLMGIQPQMGGFFKPRDIQLAWYETIEEAEKEREAALEALEAGRKMYHLQYFTPVKRHGFFGVQIDYDKM